MRYARIGQVILLECCLPCHRSDLRVALDTVKLETERQAQSHLQLAQQFRAEMEAPTAAFHNRQLQLKKQHQTPIEKEFKNKQAHEAHVAKAREKYEQDCMRINSFTAQMSLVQGKDLEKISVKLDRAQQTVQVNEKEFSNFTKILEETVHKWEQSWKSFCDVCQDIEEQRMEFMKDNIWGYANAVSTVCVSDDEGRSTYSPFPLLCLRQLGLREDTPCSRANGTRTRNGELRS